MQVRRVECMCESKEGKLCYALKLQPLPFTLYSIETKIDSTILTSQYKSNTLRFFENIWHQFSETGSVGELYQYLQVSCRDSSSSVMVPILSSGL